MHIWWKTLARLLASSKTSLCATYGAEFIAPLCHLSGSSNPYACCKSNTNGARYNDTGIHKSTKNFSPFFRDQERNLWPFDQLLTYAHSLNGLRWTWAIGNTRVLRDFGFVDFRIFGFKWKFCDNFSSWIVGFKCKQMEFLWIPLYFWLYDRIPATKFSVIGLVNSADLNGILMDLLNLMCTNLHLESAWIPLNWRSKMNFVWTWIWSADNIFARSNRP